MQLTIASETAMSDDKPLRVYAEQAKQLIERVQLEAIESVVKNEIVDIITTIAVYKLSSLSREEVEAMLGLRLEDTKVYQEAKAEGRKEREVEMLKAIVPLLLNTGMSIEQIAQQLKVDVETIQLAAQEET